MVQQLALVIPLVGISLLGLFFLGRKKRPSDIEDYGAIVEKLEILPSPPPPPPAAPHRLEGLTFSIKDIFDVEGYVTGFGNPDWKLSHEPASSTAPVVRDLVNAGAKCVGKTIMDELAFSITGENKHYGTPVNPAAPKRVPGGSSSGSAVVVAANLVDFSIGTDTAGSVRVPAAYCGVIGFRPSHGAVSSKGCIPMAPSLDSIGWFARDTNVLREVGQILLSQPYLNPRPLQKVLAAIDCFEHSNHTKRLFDSVSASIEKVSGKIIKQINLGEYLASNVPTLKYFAPNDDKSSDDSLGSKAFAALRDAMRALQSFEFKSSHEEWIQTTKPSLSTDIDERVRLALSSNNEKAAVALRIKEEVRSAINDLLKADAVLLLPTSPCLPPLLNSKPETLNEIRNKSLLFLSIASMSGCPQVSLPAGSVENGIPIAASLLSRHGSDHFLLAVANIFAVPFKDSASSRSAKSSWSASTPPAQKPPAEVAKDKGNEAYKEKNFKKALSFYSEAIKLDSSNATYFSNRAMAHLQLCNFQEAEADCTTALLLDRRAVKAMLRRGTAREFQGYYKEALEDFQQALVYEPTNRTAMESIQRLKSLIM